MVTKEAMAYVEKVISKAKSFEKKYFAKDVALHNVQPLMDDEDASNSTAS